MMLYNVEFSQDGKILDDYIGDYVKAWNTEEAKDYALTWYNRARWKRRGYRRYTGVLI